MDGLVSTGKQIPYAILKKKIAIPKIFYDYFINIFIWLVDKGMVFLLSFLQKKSVAHF